MNEQPADPYGVLGVSSNASQLQIAQAYRRLAKRYHPDVQNDGQSSERMRRINQAWEILSSPVERARNDADHAMPRVTSNGHWSGPRRVTPARPEPMAWNAAWSAAPSEPPRYDRPYQRDATMDGPTWPGIMLLIVLGTAAFLLLLVGVVPFPLLGIVFLVIVRGLLRNIDA